VPESVYVFWVVVAILAAAAGWNHGWHHLRRTHLTARLSRASYREGRAALVLLDGRVVDGGHPDLDPTSLR
jgi:hypothetical protein